MPSAGSQHAVAALIFYTLQAECIQVSANPILFHVLLELESRRGVAGLNERETHGSS